VTSAIQNSKFKIQNFMLAALPRKGGLHTNSSIFRGEFLEIFALHRNSLVRKTLTLEETAR
jgi:hypothetical protein